MPPSTRHPKPKFTVDWFTNNVPIWQRYLVPAFADRKGTVRALEIGSYEGRSALWLLDNVLVSPRSSVTCVDDFREVAPATTAAGVRDVRAAFSRNTAAYGDRIKLVEEPAERALRKMFPAEEEAFSIVYIDATKDSRFVLEQAVLAFPLLKKNGFMVFDDYTSSPEHDGSCPKQGIDAFLDVYAPYIKVRHVGWQVILQRRATPLKSARRAQCFSEYFE